MFRQSFLRPAQLSVGQINKGGGLQTPCLWPVDPLETHSPYCCGPPLAASSSFHLLKLQALSVRVKTACQPTPWTQRNFTRASLSTRTLDCEVLASPCLCRSCRYLDSYLGQKPGQRVSIRSSTSSPCNPPTKTTACFLALWCCRGAPLHALAVPAPRPLPPCNCVYTRQNFPQSRVKTSHPTPCLRLLLRSLPHTHTAQKTRKICAPWSLKSARAPAGVWKRFGWKQSACA